MKTRLQVGLAVTFLGLVGALAYQLVTPEQVVPGRHIRIPWPEGEAPADSLCVELDGLASPEARALFGLHPDGGFTYCHLRIGAAEAPEGVEYPALPEGMLAIDPYHVLDGGPCEYQLEAWCDYQVATGLVAACAPATPDGEPVPSDCEWRLLDGGWAPAPLRVHFPAGTWRGGCVPKPGGEVAGVSSWPAGCGPEDL